MDSNTLLAAIAGAFLLAGFVKGAIGLGLPTVSIGLLGLLMPPAQAAAILVVPSLVTNIWQALVGGNFWDLARRLWPVFAGICVGTFIGAVLLPHDDTQCLPMLVPKSKHTKDEHSPFEAQVASSGS